VIEYTRGASRADLDRNQLLSACLTIQALAWCTADRLVKNWKGIAE
jgi:hypothetical protein